MVVGPVADTAAAAVAVAGAALRENVLLSVFIAGRTLVSLPSALLLVFYIYIIRCIHTHTAIIMA